MRTVVRYAKWWLGGQVSAAVLGGALVVLVEVVIEPRRWDFDETAQWVAFALAVGLVFLGVLTFEFAVVVAVVALRALADLPRRWIAAAAAIWLLVVTEVLGLYLFL